MLHALRGAYQGEVGEGIFLLFSFLHDFLAFFHKAHHPFAGLRASGLAEKRKALIEPFDLTFGFNQVLLKALAQTVEPCRLRHFGERFGELLLRVENVFELVH